MDKNRMRNVIQILLIGLTYTMGISQSYFYKIIDIKEFGSIKQIFQKDNRVFISSQLACSSGLVCSNLSEIDEFGNILFSKYIEDVDAAISTAIHGNNIFMSGVDPFGNSNIIVKEIDLNGTITKSKVFNFTKDGESMNLGYMRLLKDQLFLIGQIIKDNKSSSIIATMDLDFNLIKTHIDTSIHNNVIWDTDVGPDSLLTCFVLENGLASPYDRRRIEKYDKDLNLVWKYQPPDSLLIYGNDIKLYGTILDNGNIFFSYYKFGWNDRLPNLQCIDTLTKKSVWDYDFPNNNSHNRTVFRAKQLNNGDILITGKYATLSSNPRIRDSPWLMRLDRNGNKKWERTYVELGTDGQDKTGALWDAIELDNGDVMACGFVRNNNNRWEPLLIRTDADGCIDQGQANCPTVQIIDLMSGAVNEIGEATVSIFPNPTSGIIRISKSVQKIQVFNQLGSLVISKYNTNEIDLSDLDSSMYIISLSDNHGVISSHKVIKID